MGSLVRAPWQLLGALLVAAGCGRVGYERRVDGAAAEDGAADAVVVAPRDGSAEASSPCLPTCSAGERCAQRCEGDCACPAGCACDLTCAERSSCGVQCVGLGTRCELTASDSQSPTLSCAAQTSCALHASGNSDGAVHCAPGASCEAHCAGNADCTLECPAGAACLLACRGNARCAFSACAAPVDCGSGVRACGRACP